MRISIAGKWVMMAGILCALCQGARPAGPATRPAGEVTTRPTTSATRPSVTAATRPAVGSRAATKPAAKASEKYTPASEEAIQAVNEFGEEMQKLVLEEMKVKLARLETDHFQIYTDWDPREHVFLRDNFEAAYAGVSRQFNIPVKENIFIGKLPCFVFVTYDAFAKFLAKYKVRGVVPDVQGIYIGNEYGLGFMVVHKPQADRTEDKLQARMNLWKYVLAHEMTHAFVARYISNRDVVTWLNEGIAEVVASTRFPRDIREECRYAAERYRSLSRLFADDNGFKDAEMYPVMRSLVEVLIKKDHKAFMKMFDEIKGGKDPEEALKDNYKWSYAQLEAVWRQYIK